MSSDHAESTVSFPVPAPVCRFVIIKLSWCVYHCDSGGVRPQVDCSGRLGLYVDRVSQGGHVILGVW